MCVVLRNKTHIFITLFSYPLVDIVTKKSNGLCKAGVVYDDSDDFSFRWFLFAILQVGRTTDNKESRKYLSQRGKSEK